MKYYQLYFNTCTMISVNIPLRDRELILKKPPGAFTHSEPHHIVLNDFRHVYFLELFKRESHIKITVLIVVQMTDMRV